MNKNSSFSQLLQNAKLFVYGLTRGTILFTPRSFKMWEQIMQYLNADFQNAGVENVNFPALIPLSVIQQEKENFQGFSPELMLITQVGEEKLSPSQFLVLRPTSEVVFCHYFRQVLNSYRDLPILLNQWTNVWRWEKNTNPFLRTVEFLWNEGHSLHSTATEANQNIKTFSKIYGDFLEKVLLIPTIHGFKSAAERFAGAEKTLTFETLLPDGQFLQLATAHTLGQNFARVFKLLYLDQENKLTHPWQTSWGLSTRVLAGVFLTHRDEKGLILPPQIADCQIVILLFLAKKDSAVVEAIQKFANHIVSILKAKKYRIKVVDDQQKSFGYWANEYEMQGIPLRLEIGAKEVTNQNITVVPRVSLQKSLYTVQDFSEQVADIFKNIEIEMWNQASDKMKNKRVKITSYSDYQKIKIKDAAYEVFFCGEIICEQKIKVETNTTSRVLKNLQKDNKCFHCGKFAKYSAVFGRSY